MDKFKMLVFILLLITFACDKEGVEPDFDDDDHIFIPDATTPVLKVGNNKEFTSIAAAAAAATDSCIVEIDAGTYSGDVTLWKQNCVIIRSAGGEVILDAAGKYWDGKGIWEINGGIFIVEGITFKNCKVPDRNGAGIRLSKGFLTVKNCKFMYNEMGILTTNDGISTLNVQNCEFAYNFSSSHLGYTHNIYVGEMAKFSVSGSWFHHASHGHLIKTRAALSIIRYNLISDGNDEQSQASYEIDFASGGIGVVVGNIIQQSKNTQNAVFISYCREGRVPWTENELYVSHNTIINNRTTTDPVIEAPESLRKYVGAFNNVMSKNTRFNMNIMDIEAGNIQFEEGDLTTDYAPTKQSADTWLNKIDRNADSHLSKKLKDMGISLIPTAEYVHPMKIQSLEKAPTIPGAYQPR